jgi:hypothetical protein
MLLLAFAVTSCIHNVWLLCLGCSICPLLPCLWWLLLLLHGLALLLGELLSYCLPLQETGDRDVRVEGDGGGKGKVELEQLHDPQVNRDMLLI